MNLMTPSPEHLMLLRYLAITLLGVAFGGLGYTLVEGYLAGAGVMAQSVSEETSRRFEDIFLFIPARRISEIARAAAAAAFLLCFVPLFDHTNPISTVVGIVLGLSAGTLALLAPGRLLAALRERRRKKFNLQLVEALGSMSNALRAGFSVNQAFEGVVQNGEKPIAQEFGVMLQQMRVGMSFYDALQSLDKRVGSDDLTLVVTAIDISRRTGGNLTEIFDKISMTIRERMRIELRVQTLTAQGRLQGIIMACMPALLGAAMTFIKPGMMLPFFKSVNGMIAIALTIGLIGCGWFFISRIIRIDV